MKKKKAAADPSSMDRLSTLPENVLNRILCFLSQKESVRTCVLSKSWRHRGSTRSKLKLSLSHFNDDKDAFVSVLDNSLQRYHDRTLCISELHLDMSVSKPYDKSPLQFDLLSIASKHESLQVLYLAGGNFKRVDAGKLWLKHLRRLTLDEVCIRVKNLETVLSRCPLIEYLWLQECTGLMAARKGSSLQRKIGSIRIAGAPTLETMCILDCGYWYFGDNYFPRLKTLDLTSVRLSTESFGFFTSEYMPSLEKFGLCCCYGFKEFQLSSASIKYLHMKNVRDLIKATIDAPNIIYFELTLEDTVPSISFTPVSNEWKSSIDLSFCSQYDNSDGASDIAINALLNAVSQSHITLIR